MSLPFVLAIIPMLPGVNGNSASALRAVRGDLAKQEGFGVGEFAAWSNNLRALAGAAAPVIYGNVYSWCARNNVSPGKSFWAAAVFGALVPEVLLRGMEDEELCNK